MKYTDIKTLEKTVAKNDYNKWAIDMLKLISTDNGWEESETKYFKEFFNL